MKNSYQNIEVLLVNPGTQTATVYFLDLEVMMPIPLDVLKDKIDSGLYALQSDEALL